MIENTALSGTNEPAPIAVTRAGATVNARTAAGYGQNACYPRQPDDPAGGGRGKRAAGPP
jgi:hypothetical protein